MNYKLKDLLPHDFATEGGPEFQAFISLMRKLARVDPNMAGNVTQYYYFDSPISDHLEYSIGCPRDRKIYTVEQLKAYFTDKILRNSKIWFGTDKNLGKRVFEKLQELGASGNWVKWTRNDTNPTSKSIGAYYIGGEKQLNGWDHDTSKAHFDQEPHFELDPEVLLQLTPEKQSTKPVIGYKSPIILTNLNNTIPAGTVFKPNKTLNGYSYEGLYIPKEIAEIWEPVYEIEKVTLIIGNDHKVEISNVIQSVNRIIKPDEIRSLLEITDQIAGWDVEFTEYSIGCVKQVKRAQLQEVLDTWEKLNK